MNPHIVLTYDDQVVFDSDTDVPPSVDVDVDSPSTPETEPSAPPEVDVVRDTLELSVDPGDGFATLKWTVLDTNTSAITGFHVGRGGVDTNGTAEWSTIDAGTTRSRIFTSLANDVEYTLFVASVTEDGEGERSTILVTPRAKVIEAVPPAPPEDVEITGVLEVPRRGSGPIRLELPDGAIALDEGTYSISGTFTVRKVDV